ncbi:MAG: hypothetical protein QOJ97_163 [Solirubrobacteraceae bacterium]|jgi:hypothetical protein|nr:hypothetical protein [Solirubrobacteraceae bacterium]
MSEHEYDPSLSVPTGLAVGLARKEIALRNVRCDSPRTIRALWFPRFRLPWHAEFGWYERRG